jgi:hypothetical protein
MHEQRSVYNLDGVGVQSGEMMAKNELKLQSKTGEEKKFSTSSLMRKGGIKKGTKIESFAEDPNFLKKMLSLSPEM